MNSKYKTMVRGMQKKVDLQSGCDDENWHLYMLRCGDESLYTGITKDLNRRLKMHEKGKASRYTRTHQPVKLVYQEFCGSRVQALVRELEVKSFPRSKKEKMISARVKIKKKAKVKKTGIKKKVIAV